MGRLEMQVNEQDCGLVRKTTGHSTPVTICSAIAGSSSDGNRSRAASAFAVEWRTTRVVLIRYSTPVPCVTIDCTSASQARRAISVLSNLTVVKGGSVNSAIWMSSKPTTDMSSGTRSPHWRMARMAPIAVRSLEAMTAVGRGARASRRSIAFSPPSTLWFPSSVAVSRHAPKHGSLSSLRKASRRSRADARLSGPEMNAIRRCPSPLRCSTTWDLDLKGGNLTGVEKRGANVFAGLAGVRAPVLKRNSPKAWTAAEPIFNGKDLTGWDPTDPALANHWVAKDGELLNESKGANLK